MGSCTSKPMSDPPSPDPPIPVPLPQITPDMRYVRQPGPSNPHPRPHSSAPPPAQLTDPRKASDPGSNAPSVLAGPPVPAKGKGPLNGSVGRAAGEDVKGKRPARGANQDLVASNDLDAIANKAAILEKTRRVLEAGSVGGLVTEQGTMEAKILLLGSGESGKSTILKQMKILHGGGFTPVELVQYKQIIRHNLLDSAQALLRVVLNWGYQPYLGEMPPGWNGTMADDAGYGSEAVPEFEDIMENLPGTDDFSVPIRLPEDEEDGAGRGRGKGAPGGGKRQAVEDRQPLSFLDMMDVDARQFGGEWANARSAGPASIASKKSKKKSSTDPAAVDSPKGPAGSFQLGWSNPAAPPVPAVPAVPSAYSAANPRAARSLLSISQTSTTSDFGYAGSASPTTSAFQVDYDRVPFPRAQGSQPTIMSTASGNDMVRALLEFQLQEGKNIPVWVAAAVVALWQNQPFMNEVLRRSNEFYLMDNAPYFFKHTMRICHPQFWPTDQDVLRSRVQTRGVTESRFVADQMHIHMYDVGGQRAERKKWIYAFEKVKCVIFTVSLSEYDQTLLESPEQNRMQESIKLFENILASRWFQNATFVIFFNKMDVFEEKYKRSPLKLYFAEYGGKDVESGVKFIVWRYRQVNRSKVNVYSHITTATDTKRIQTVLASVRENILDTALRESGLI